MASIGTTLFASGRQSLIVLEIVIDIVLSAAFAGDDEGIKKLARSNINTIKVSVDLFLNISTPPEN